MEKLYWVYMLQCADDSFDIGVTGNIDVRMYQHSSGIDRKCYTFSRRPLTLVYHQEFAEILQAIDAEKKLKGWSRAKKFALIAGDWDAIRELSRSNRTVSAKARGVS